jgi:phosphoribosylaminoimidazole carboxylase (NCAIR synthetase)
MHAPGSTYLGRLKRALTGDAGAPAAFICNFEVEGQWAAGHIGLPAPPRSASPVVARMDELGILLAGPDDCLILKQVPDPDFRAYLAQAGFEPPAVLAPAAPTPDRSTADDILADPTALATLARWGSRGARLMPMGTAASEQKLAEAAGLPLAVPDAATFERVNSKIYSRRSTDSLGLRAVPGWCVETVGELARTLGSLGDDLSAGGVVVKDAYGVSGKGMILVDTAAKRDRLLSMVDRRARRSGDDRLAVVVEEWLPKRWDLNYQITIDRAGEVTLDFVKRAITDNGVHQGHTFPIELGAARTAELEHAATAIGRQLYADGFTGIAGIDAILATDGTLYPVLEINARFNMSTYQGAVTERFLAPGWLALARHYPLRLREALPFARLHDGLAPLLAGGAHGRAVITCFATVNAAAGIVAPPFDGRLYTMLFAADQRRLADLEAAIGAALAPFNEPEKKS